MTKQEILDYFSLIDFAYNESGRFESLSRMLDELLKEREAVTPTWQQGKAYCGACGKRISLKIGARYCHKCGKELKWK